MVWRRLSAKVVVIPNMASCASQSNTPSSSTYAPILTMSVDFWNIKDTCDVLTGTQAQFRSPLQI